MKVKIDVVFLRPYNTLTLQNKCDLVFCIYRYVKSKCSEALLPTTTEYGSRRTKFC